MKRTLLRGTTWLTGVIVILALVGGCTTGSVNVGFRHTELVNEVDGSGDNNGWDLGGGIGFEFSGAGLHAIETCAGGAAIFSNASFDDGDLKTNINTIPASACMEFELNN